MNKENPPETIVGDTPDFWSYLDSHRNRRILFRYVEAIFNKLKEHDEKIRIKQNEYDLNLRQAKILSDECNQGEHPDSTLTKLINEAKELDQILVNSFDDKESIWEFNKGLKKTVNRSIILVERQFNQYY